MALFTDIDVLTPVDDDGNNVDLCRSIDGRDRVATVWSASVTVPLAVLAAIQATQIVLGHVFIVDYHAGPSGNVGILNHDPFWLTFGTVGAGYTCIANFAQCTCHGLRRFFFFRMVPMECSRHYICLWGDLLFGHVWLDVEVPVSFGQPSRHR